LPPDPTDNGIGVCGVGDDYGVFGKGLVYAGVHGETGSNSTGVFGVGSNIEAIGVVGINKVRDQGSKRTGGGVGIVGATDSDEGFGVAGLGMKSLDTTGPRSVPKPIIDEKGNLVVRDNLGNAIGVVGASGDGTGVHGMSRTGRGGVFESGVGAQINLKPLFETATPPRDGQPGDLVVITKMKEGDTTGQHAELWFCVSGRDLRTKRPVWGKVQFSELHSL
jgi:hypothetical protein